MFFKRKPKGADRRVTENEERKHLPGSFVTSFLLILSCFGHFVSYRKSSVAVLRIERRRCRRVIAATDMLHRGDGEPAERCQPPAVRAGGARRHFFPVGYLHRPRQEIRR